MKIWAEPTKVILLSFLSSFFFFSEQRCLLRLPGFKCGQQRFPKLAGVPDKKGLPCLAQRSLDSLASYLPIQHRRHGIYGLRASLIWRLRHRQSHTHGGKQLPKVRACQHSGKWMCEVYGSNLVSKRCLSSAYRQFISTWLRFRRKSEWWCCRKRRQFWILPSCKFEIPLYFKLRSSHSVLVWEQMTDFTTAEQRSFFSFIRQ